MTDESRASILSPLICLAGLSLWAGDAHSYHLDMVLALIRRRGRKGKYIPFAHSISAHTYPCPAVWLTARMRIAGRRGESTFNTSHHRKTSSQQCLRAAQPATTHYTKILTSTAKHGALHVELVRHVAAKTKFFSGGWRATFCLSNICYAVRYV